MDNNNTIRVTATITLAFVLMLLTSLFATGLSKVKTNTSKPILEKNKTVIRNEKHVEKPLKKKNDKKVNKTKSSKNDKNVEAKNKTLLTIVKDTTTNKDTCRNDSNKPHHKATWYRTEGTRVHKEHPEIHGTAAYNFVPRGTRLLITNKENGKSCVVEVTDRMGHRKPNHIDLSHSAFGILSNHSYGKISVIVKILE